MNTKQTKPRNRGKTPKAAIDDRNSKTPPAVEGTRLRRPARSLTIDLVIEALRVSSGIRSVAARKLGVTRQAITNFGRRHPELAEAESEIRDELVDLAEGKLLTAVNKGEFNAIRYFLDNHGSDAGYGKKRLELSTQPGAPLECEIRQSSVPLDQLPEEERNAIIEEYTGKFG